MRDLHNAPRLPEIVLLGTMKSGTTTLFSRLGSHPEVFEQRAKEPNFFSDATVWQRGTEWYASLFARPHTFKAVDASVAYTLPDSTERSAARLRTVVPEARLVVLVRNPIARTRAHYLHEVQRGRETRTFLEAVTDDSVYVRASQYDHCLAPYQRDLRRLLVLRTEDLDSEAHWLQLLEHLRLSPAPRPSLVRNVGTAKQPFTRLGTALWQRGALQRAGRIPKPLRRFGARFVMGPSERASALVRSAAADFPDRLVKDLLDHALRFGDRWGIDVSEWTTSMMSRASTPNDG